MGAYQYVALKQSGNSCKGVLEADSERHARQLLREQGLLPTQVFPLKKPPLTKHKNKLAASDLSLLTRQLATLIAAGITVEESLSGVSEQAEKPKVRQLLTGVRAKVREGYSLAQALSDYPIAFPELYCATVAAGEQTGRLDVVLEKLADYTENQQKTRQKINQALIYPTIMVLVSLTIIGFLMVFVVPKIIEVFSSSGQTLPPMTRVLIDLCAFVKHYGLYLALLLLVLFIGFKKSLRNPKVRWNWHRLLLRIPFVSYLITSVNVARYIHTFSILFAAGVSILDTMRVASSVVSQLIIRQAFEQAALKVREGTAIGVALKDTRFLNPLASHLITSGEKSGQLAGMMERAANQLDNEVKRIVDTGLTLLEPIIILLMGAVVLFIVLATLLPIFSMEQLVT